MNVWKVNIVGKRRERKREKKEKWSRKVIKSNQEWQYSKWTYDPYIRNAVEMTQPSRSGAEGLRLLQLVNDQVVIIKLSGRECTKELYLYK